MGGGEGHFFFQKQNQTKNFYVGTWNTASEQREEYCNAWKQRKNNNLTNKLNKKHTLTDAKFCGKRPEKRQRKIKFGANDIKHHLIASQLIWNLAERLSGVNFPGLLAFQQCLRPLHKIF